MKVTVNWLNKVYSIVCVCVCMHTTINISEKRHLCVFVCVHVTINIGEKKKKRHGFKMESPREVLMAERKGENDAR